MNYLSRFLFFSPLLSLLLILMPGLSGPELRAADVFSGLASTDDRRVAATVAGNPATLEPLLSSELSYAHSNGKVDSRDSFLSALRDGSLRYHSIQYESREFRAASPDVVLMTGRARVEVGQPASILQLAFLAVWRLENGQWRFLAWQSCRLPTAP